MRPAATCLLALGAAVLVPTAITVAYFGVAFLLDPNPNNVVIVMIALVAFLVSLGHVILLGLPGVLLLAKTGKMNARTISTLGFVCGCLPTGVFTWPIDEALRNASSSEWDGEKTVQSLVNGVPTLVGWISYGKGVLTMGILGAAAAFVFWQVWKCSGSPATYRRERT